LINGRAVADIVQIDTSDVTIANDGDGLLGHE